MSCRIFIHMRKTVKPSFPNRNSNFLFKSSALFSLLENSCAYNNRQIDFNSDSAGFQRSIQPGSRF